MHAPDDVHPDADLLTAFTEQTLTRREREQVLLHLASCADCRDVVALALPEKPLSIPAAEPVKPLFWRWPILRWGAVAASVVIVAGAVFIGNQEHKKHSTETQVAEVRLNPSPNLQSPATESKTQQPPAQTFGSSGVQRPKIRYERIPSDSRTAALPSVAKERTDNLTVAESQKKDENLAVGKIVAGVVAPQAQPPAAVDESVNSTVFKRDAGTYSPTARMKAAVPPPPPSVPPNATETVEVSSAAVQVESANAAPVGGPVLQADKTDSKLTDAASSFHGQAALAKKQLTRFAAATNWRISNRLLQRSFDSGQTWEQARPEASFSAVSSIGNEIWAGGAKGLLMHSADAGQSWFTVSPGMTGDVSSLQFTDSRHGIAKTSTGETWETKDGGKSWTKQ